MRNVVPVDDTRRIAHACANVRRKFRHPHAIAAHTRGQAVVVIPVDEGVLVLSPSKHGVRFSRSDAFAAVAGKRLIMTQASGEIIEIVIKPLVPVRICTVHAGDAVEGFEQRHGR
jgi:hypothetical protein